MHHGHAKDHAYLIAGSQGSIADGLKRAHEIGQAAVLGMLPTMLMAAFWLIKEGILGQKFASLLQLIGLMGVNKIAHKYNRHRYFWSCMYACSEVLLCSTIARGNASPFLRCFVMVAQTYVLRTTAWYTWDFWTRHPILLSQFFCAALV